MTKIFHKALLFICLLFVINSAAQTSQQFQDSTKNAINNLLVDSLKTVLKQQKESDKIEIYYALSQNFNTETDSAYIYINKGIQLAKKLNENKNLIIGYDILAEYWYQLGNADSSLVAIEQVIELIPNKPSLERAKAFNNYGQALMQKADYYESAKWYLKSLDDAEKINDPKGIVRSLNKLGTIYWYLNDLTSALSYYNRALAISKKNSTDNSTAKILGNIGLIKHSQGKLKDSEIAFKEALKMKRKLNNQLEVAITLQNMGRLYQQLKEFTKAKSYYSQSINISKQIDDHIGVIYTLQNLASLEANTNNHNLALKLLDTALIRAKKINFKEGIKDVYNISSYTLAEMGRPKEAFKYRLLYEAWKDSVSNEKYLEKTKALEIKYETEKKQNKILSLSQENLKKEVTISKKNASIKTLLFSGLLLAILVIAIFMMYRQKTLNKKQQAVVEAMAKTELKEQQRISRDLHDSVGAMLGAVNNQLSKLASTNRAQEENLKKTKQLLTKTADETRRISHNMMPEELVKFGLVNAVENLIENLVSDKKNNIDFVHFGIEERLDSIKELHLYRIIQELFQNIQKHAKASKSTLQLTKHHNELNVLVEDNGKGFTLNEETNSGAGLQNIRARVQFLKGKVHIDSKIDIGTTVNINIPLI